MPIESYTRSVNDIFTYVKTQFGDEAGIQFGISQVLDWINAGQRDIVAKNHTINEALARTNIVAGQAEYPLNSDPAFANIQNVHTVMYDGAPLKSYTFDEAVAYIITGKENDTSGKPVLWYIKAGVLTLYPEPDTAISNGLKIYFTKAPPRVTGTGDMLGVPDNYFNALVAYVMREAYEMDENFQAAGVKAQQFEKSVGEQQNQTVTQMADFHVIQPDPEDYY